jgi:integrase
MASKRFRNGSWEFTIKRASLLDRPVSYTFDSEEAGEEWAANLEALLDRGIVPEAIRNLSKKRIKTVTQAILAHISANPVSESDLGYLAVCQAQIGGIHLSEITYGWVESWVQDMKRTERLAPDTIRHRVGAMARCLDSLTRKHPDIMAVNPIRKLPRGYATYNEADRELTEGGRDAQARDRRLSEDGAEERNIRRVIAGDDVDREETLYATPEERAAFIFLFELALESAMRLREMYTLTEDQVDVSKKTIFLQKTKNGDKRQVPMTTVAVKALDSYRAATQGMDHGQVGGQRLIFPWWDGDNAVLPRVTSNLSRQFGRIFRKAGCENLTFHDLRHEATSRLYERTSLSDLEIASITGHKDLRMLKRYSNLRASDLAAKLW